MLQSNKANTISDPPLVPYCFAWEWGSLFNRLIKQRLALEIRDKAITESLHAAAHWVRNMTGTHLIANVSSQHCFMWQDFMDIWHCSMPLDHHTDGIGINIHSRIILHKIRKLYLYSIQCNMIHAYANYQNIHQG